MEIYAKICMKRSAAENSSGVLSNKRCLSCRWCSASSRTSNSIIFTKLSIFRVHKNAFIIFCNFALTMFQLTTNECLEIVTHIVQRKEDFVKYTVHPISYAGFNYVSHRFFFHLHDIGGRINYRRDSWSFERDINIWRYWTGISRLGKAVERHCPFNPASVVTLSEQEVPVSFAQCIITQLLAQKGVNPAKIFG